MLFVTNFERCSDFYSKVFDLTPLKFYAGKEHPAYVEYQVDGATYLALHGQYVGPHHKQGNPIALHFEVDDIRETIRKVSQFGGKVVQEIRPLDFCQFAERQLVQDARVTDPDGNELELRQVLEKSENAK